MKNNLIAHSKKRQMLVTHFDALPHFSSKGLMNATLSGRTHTHTTGLLNISRFRDNGPTSSRFLCLTRGKQHRQPNCDIHRRAGLQNARLTEARYSKTTGISISKRRVAGLGAWLLTHERGQGSRSCSLFLPIIRNLAHVSLFLGCATFAFDGAGGIGDPRHWSFLPTTTRIKATQKLTRPLQNVPFCRVDLVTYVHAFVLR